MNVEIVSLRNSITKKKRLDVVCDIINQSESDLILFFSTSNSDEKHLIDSTSLQYSFYDGHRLNEITRKIINNDAQIKVFGID